MSNHVRHSKTAETLNKWYPDFRPAIKEPLATVVLSRALIFGDEAANKKIHHTKSERFLFQLAPWNYFPYFSDLLNMHDKNSNGQLTTEREVFINCVKYESVLPSIMSKLFCASQTQDVRLVLVSDIGLLISISFFLLEKKKRISPRKNLSGNMPAFFPSWIWR